MARILLHMCCGPCASACLERLRAEGHEVTLFFSNANIAPDSEYRRRFSAADKLATATNTPLVEDSEVTHAEWLKEVASGLEDEPEGGERCRRCFAFNLKRAASFAKDNGYDIFTTSLTVSPHKRSALVFMAGREVGGDTFLEEDFKKRNGFLRSIELSEALGLYRQDYCGCEFSLRDAAARAKKKATE